MKIVLPQDCETPVQEVLFDRFKYRYTYTRSSDTKEYNDIGQDYLVLHIFEDSFIFTLCDGVSQSFYGDLAARIIGDSLVDWLTEVPVNAELDSIGNTLNNYLRDLIQIAEPIISAHPIPENAPPILKTVLEEKRAKGSETTFVCGRIDLPTKEIPEGRAVFAWLGDSRLRIWEREEEITYKLGGAFETMQRWSTKQGPVGSEVHLYMSTLAGKEQLTRIAAYSDGLASFDEYTDILSNAKVEDLLEQAGKGAASDDISFIEIIVDLEGIYVKSPWLDGDNKEHSEEAIFEPIDNKNAAHQSLISLLKKGFAADKGVENEEVSPRTVDAIETRHKHRFKELPKYYFNLMRKQLKRKR